MIPGGNQTPYRVPCDGTALCGNGPRYQNAKASEKNIPVYLYDGMVPNWDECPGQPATIPPYERTNPPYNGPSNDTCGDTTYEQPTGTWMGICTDGSDNYEACSGSSTPAAGTASELFDLTNTPPISWYQPQMLTGATVADGGANYQAGDILDATGGTESNYIGPPAGPAAGVCAVTVTAVNESGAITGVSVNAPGSYQTTPASPNTMTGGHGTGASINLTFGDAMESLAQCRKIGFKNVQAARQWHGQPGYFWSGGDNGTVENYTCPSGDEGCSTTFYYGYNESAATTKYTTLEWDCVWTDEYGTDTYSGSVTVNPLSGVQTVNSYVAGDGTASEAATGNYNFNIFDFDAVDVANSISDGGYNWLCSTAPGGAQITDCDGSSMTSTCSQGDGIYTLWATSSWTSSAGSFSGELQSVYSSDTDTYFATITVDVTDSSLSLSITLLNADSTTSTLTASVSLSGANTASDILGDANTLLDEWDLTNDTEYPWRSDADTSMAPLVTRNEVPSNIAPDYAVPESGWIDPNSYLYDGSIVGSPMPAGYQGYFDFNWQDWQPYESDYQIFGWGAANTGTFGIPLNATQWTDVQTGLQFPGGAWIFYNCNPSVAGNGECFAPGAGCPNPGTTLFVQKWAETKVPLPSQNFFRPAGNDRFVYDEENVYAILSTSGGPGSGTQINLGNTANCDATVSVVASGLWGPYQNTDDNWYFWSVTGGGASVTLNAPVYLLPDNWQSASGDGAAGSTIDCFGKLRWSTGNPATDPFPILGRAGVSAVAEYESNPDVTELTTDDLPTLGMILSGIGYDAIDIYDKTMTLITSNLQVTRIDDSHFTVPVAATTLANAAWIQSHGAPAYSWDDQYPKGDYVYTDWIYRPRQSYEPTRINQVYQACAQELCGTDPSSGCDCSGITCETPAANVFSAYTQEAGCVAFNPCNPSVLCISPNGETFANGITYGFADIALDEIYGSGWQAEFQQSMVDLYWQPPHVPANNPCTPETTAWTEDDGTCESDDGTQTFYAHRPLVEARLTVPAGAPALPAGITIGWVSPVTDPDSADALYPAPSNGDGLGGTVPWATLDNECGCINADGRFADIYENQVVTCD